MLPTFRRCNNCGLKIHDHSDDDMESWECNYQLAAIELSDDGEKLWCIRCWTFVVNEMEATFTLIERQDAVAKGRHWN